jgi:hypothetical protein
MPRRRRRRVRRRRRRFRRNHGFRACMVTEGMVVHCGLGITEDADAPDEGVEEDFWEFTESEADGIDVFEVEEV